MTSKKLFLTFLIFSSLLIPTVHAFDSFYNVMPGKGAWNQEVLISVRADPRIDNEQMYMRVFWDNLPITDRLPSPRYKTSKTLVEHRWDKTITPPVNYNQKGKHIIEIWLEKDTGEIKKHHWQYTITEDQLTTVEAWEEFIKDNPQIIREITGDPGPIGDTGQTGPKGDKGPIGPIGEIGPIGPPGESITGEQGPQGEPGKPPSYLIVIAICVISNGITLAYLKYKENEQEEPEK